MVSPFNHTPVTQFQSSVSTPWYPPSPTHSPVTTTQISEPTLLVLCHQKKPTYALAKSMKTYEDAISNVRMHYPKLKDVEADKVSFYVFTDNELIRIAATVWEAVFPTLGESRFVCVEVDGEPSSLPAFPFRFSISQWFVPPMEFPPLPPANWSPYPLPTCNSSVEFLQPPPPFTPVTPVTQEKAPSQAPEEKPKRRSLLGWMKALVCGSDKGEVRD